MNNKYDKIINKTKEISIKIIGKEISKIFIDYYACWTKSWAKCIKEKEMIIFDKFLIDYGDWDLIETLIVHECCHLKIKGHKEDFQKLYKKFRDNNYDIEKHTNYKIIINKLISENILNKDTNWVKEIQPIYQEVKEYLESEEEGIILN